MNAISLHRAADSQHRSGEGTRLRTAQMCGALIGLGGGIAVAMLGSLLTLSSWMTRDGVVKQWLATAATALLCSTVPLIILGAFCLDWLEKNKSPPSVKDMSNEDETDDR